MSDHEPPDFYGEALIKFEGNEVMAAFQAAIHEALHDVITNPHGCGQPIRYNDDGLRRLSAAARKAIQ